MKDWPLPELLIKGFIIAGSFVYSRASFNSSRVFAKAYFAVGSLRVSLASLLMPSIHS